MPNDTFIRLPSDSGNTGHKSAAQQRAQGADTVVIPRVIVAREAVVSEVYRVASMSLVSLGVSANNGTTSGILWLMNPTASTKNIRIRRISLQYNFIGVTTLTTLPRIVGQRFTWSGTASGASLQAAPISSSANSSVADIRTAMTGLTITLINPTVVCDLSPMAQVAGVAAVLETAPSTRSELIDSDASEDEWITLTPGQGFVLWQADAGGATTETRKLLPTIVYDEVEA